jgi:hypothetical protein
VEKYGGDRFLWFLRKGGVTREPDFIAMIGDDVTLLEFQYAEKEGLLFYDFKVSKVAKKKGKKRLPFENKLFVYIHKPSYSYVFFTPKWIVENGEYGFVPAWRSYAFRVPREKFEKILVEDNSLKDIIQSIDAKNYIRLFQHQLFDIWKERLSPLLQSVVDEEKIVKVIPKDLDSFFRVCFILDNINKVPENASLWLIYLLTYYGKVELKDNERRELLDKVNEILKIIRNYAIEDGTYRSSRVVINLLEDMIQDMIFYYYVDLKPITRIYSNVRDVRKTYDVIKDEREERDGWDV